VAIKTDLGIKKGEPFNLISAIEFHYNNKPESKKDRSYFYMSEAGKCKKAIYYSFKNSNRKSFDAKTKRILENGDYVHMRYQKLFAEMGILIGAELELNNDLIHGRADALITDGEKNYIIDIKSCSQWTYNTLTEAKPDDKIQLMMYLYFFNIPDGYLLYENKDNQMIKLFAIKLDTKLIEGILSDLKKLKENIDSGVEPECVYDKDKCKYCDYKDKCNSYIIGASSKNDTPIEYIG
jgi:CRISPR/Cas system-associated exonuclease Cas4 (RecB family)